MNLYMSLVWLFTRVVRSMKLITFIYLFIYLFIYFHRRTHLKLIWMVNMDKISLHMNATQGIAKWAELIHRYTHYKESCKVGGA